MSPDTWQLGVTEISSAYWRGDLSPREVFAALASRIEWIDPEIGAFTTLTLDRAEQEAVARTEEIARGESRGPLHGIPVAIKELFDVGDARTTYGSELLRDRVAPVDAEAVRRLRQAGAIVLGLTRSHEFGWGITTQHARLGGTRNPWDLDRVPGGSSGGAAAAVACGLVPLALGSDTGGSIRIPAAFCGIAGLKPTYGRISKRGAVSLAPSLDHPGPLARDARDLALALSALAGYDPDDPSTMAEPAPAVVGLDADIAGLRIGLAPDLHLTPLRPDHAAVFQSVVGALADAAVVKETRFPEAAEIRPSFTAIQMAEAYYVHTSVLGTFPARASEYGGDVRSRLVAAAGVGIVDYLAATERARQIRRRFEIIFADVDVLLTPVAAGGPSTIARPDTVEHLGSEIPFRDLVMNYTVPQDLAGLPACSVRVGFDQDGIPIAVQVTARRGREDWTLRVARWLQTAFADVQTSWPAVARPRPSGDGAMMEGS